MEWLAEIIYPLLEKAKHQEALFSAAKSAANNMVAAPFKGKMLLPFSMIVYQ